MISHAAATELVRLRARARDQPVLEPGSCKRERERGTHSRSRTLQEGISEVTRERAGAPDWLIMRVQPDG